MPKKKYPKITKKDLEEGVKKWKEENEWEEEFEDGLSFDTEFDLPYLDSKPPEAFIINKETTYDFLVKYLGKPKVGKQGYEESIKVIIKARKGEIVIRRVLE